MEHHRQNAHREVDLESFNCLQQFVLTNAVEGVLEVQLDKCFVG